MVSKHKKLLCIPALCLAALLLSSCSTHVVRKPDTTSVDHFIVLPGTESPAPEAPDIPDVPDVPGTPDAPEMTPEPTEELPPQPPATVLAETEDMGQEYLDKIIFRGDSTTYGMKYYGVLSGGKDTQQVWTPSSGTLTLSYQGFATIVYPPTGEEIPIRDAVERTKPEMMVITLGVNGVSFMDEDYFKSEYSSLVNDIKAISPDTKIILQSIFPVASTYEYLSSIITRTLPKRTNGSSPSQRRPGAAILTPRACSLARAAGSRRNTRTATACISMRSHSASLRIISALTAGSDNPEVN